MEQTNQITPVRRLLACPHKPALIRRNGQFFSNRKGISDVSRGGGRQAIRLRSGCSTWLSYLGATGSKSLTEIPHKQNIRLLCGGLRELIS